MCDLNSLLPDGSADGLAITGFRWGDCIVCGYTPLTIPNSRRARPGTAAWKKMLAWFKRYGD